MPFNRGKTLARLFFAGYSIPEKPAGQGLRRIFTGGDVDPLQQKQYCIPRICGQSAQNLDISRPSDRRDCTKFCHLLVDRLHSIENTCT
jgi:hypothetical protein